MKQKWNEKRLYEYFKRPPDKIAQEKTRTGLRRRNLKKRTESILVAAQNFAIRADYCKA